MTTTTIKLTKDEAERLAKALNFYDVEYIHAKIKAEPESKFWDDEWLKNLDLFCKITKAKARLNKKEEA